MLKKILCVLWGHDYEEYTEYYGKLDNGQPLYKLVYGNCTRCNKPIKNKKHL